MSDLQDSAFVPDQLTSGVAHLQVSLNLYKALSAHRPITQAYTINSASSGGRRAAAAAEIQGGNCRHAAALPVNISHSKSRLMQL